MRMTIPITPYTLQKIVDLIQENTAESFTVLVLFLVLCVFAITLAVRRGKK